MARGSVVWVIRTSRGPTCACGCGATLPRQRYYGKLRLIYGEYPRFLPGHQNKTAEGKALITGRPDVRTVWAREQGRQFCKCGCGKEIVVRPEHKGKGIPEYALGHNPASRDSRKGKTPGVRGRRFGTSLSIQILVKCRFRCAKCGWGGQRSAHLLEFDHVIPVSSGGKTTVNNGQSLCRPCHLSKTGRERVAIRIRNIELAGPSRSSSVSKKSEVSDG